MDFSIFIGCWRTMAPGMQTEFPAVLFSYLYVIVRFTPVKCERCAARRPFQCKVVATSSKSNMDRVQNYLNFLLQEHLCNSIHESISYFCDLWTSHISLLLRPLKFNFFSWEQTNVSVQLYFNTVTILHHTLLKVFLLLHRPSL